MKEPRFDEKGCHNCNHHNMNHKPCDINTICQQGCEWEVIPDPLSVFKLPEKEVPLTAEEMSLKDKILEEAKNGNIVVSTSEGLMAYSLKEVVEQPTSGLLYDLNRDQATILTFINDPKWINDYACYQVICELKSRLDASKFQPKEIVLPSDEEIMVYFNKHSRHRNDSRFINIDIPIMTRGDVLEFAKWLRNLIKEQNKGVITSKDLSDIDQANDERK
jgi:hypothetical protein